MVGAKLSKKTILLLGSGRSGTTWVAASLAAPFRYRLLFEPFHASHVPDARLVADRFVCPQQLTSEIVRFCHAGLNDEIDSDWIAQGSNRRLRMHRWRFWPRVRICKSIRTNLLVPVYGAIYGSALPIVVLMRHPGAVVESFLRVRFPWAFDIEQLLQQTSLQEEYGIPVDRLGAYADSEVGILAVRWVIENAYLLKHGNSLGITLIHYEDLVTEPVEVLLNLCDRVGIKPAKDLVERVQKPSNTTHPRSPIKKGQDPIASWRKRLPAEDVRLIHEVMDCAAVRYPR